MKRRSSGSKRFDEQRSIAFGRSRPGAGTCVVPPEPTRLAVRGNPHVLEQTSSSLISRSCLARSRQQFRSLRKTPVRPVAVACSPTGSPRRKHAHLARDRQSGLAASFRSRDRPLDQQLWRTRRPPTHPELLDWLAMWLVEHEWQLKPLHRLIMTSNAYHMSSQGDPQALAVDPRMICSGGSIMRRLECRRTSRCRLVASGQLNLRLYGPSFYPEMSDEVLATQSSQATAGAIRRRKNVRGAASISS